MATPQQSGGHSAGNPFGIAGNAQYVAGGVTGFPIPAAQRFFHTTTEGPAPNHFGSAGRNGARSASPRFAAGGRSGR